MRYNKNADKVEVLVESCGIFILATVVTSLILVFFSSILAFLEDPFPIRLPVSIIVAAVCSFYAYSEEWKDKKKWWDAFEKASPKEQMRMEERRFQKEEQERKEREEAERERAEKARKREEEERKRAEEMRKKKEELEKNLDPENRDPEAVRWRLEHPGLVMADRRFREREKIRKMREESEKVRKGIEKYQREEVMRRHREWSDEVENPWW